jgi:ribosome biogenesis GTPase / thiamine phosphate phosphatase
MDRQQKRYLRDIAKKERQKEINSKKKRRTGQVTEENWEDVADERSAGSGGEAASVELPTDAEYADAAIVISVASGRCRVFKDGEEIDCLVPGEIAVRQRSALAVGDRVIVETEGGISRLSAILPRHSELARPDPLHKHRQRLIAANIDVVIHVVSVKAPPLRPRLIDRFLIAISRGGAQPVICVNKIDLLDAEERQTELARLGVYRELSVPVIACSTKTGEGIDELRATVEKKTAALVGHSGVGKSSILNALDTRLQLATNTLHRRGTGRHTTTASTLYDFGDGTYLIDTPGIREFGLWDLTRESLREYFPEFEDAAPSCRFNDCTHTHEPDCEVKDRVDGGTLNRARYDTYVRLYNDLET